MSNLFIGHPDNPYHLSVGAVLFNSAKQVACLYFKQFRPPAQEITDDVYTLMRETLESGQGESLQDAVLRGIHEEFGATGVIKAYLGSLKSVYEKNSVPVEKTAVYFLVELTSCDDTRRSTGGEERDSIVEWQTVDFLEKRMEEQGKRLVGRSFDESEVLRRAKKYLV